MKEHEYLTNIPQSVEEYGFCKVLLVRNEVIHIKHIMTEVFVRKSVDLQSLLDEVGCSMFLYIEHLTNRLRKIHHFSRLYKNKINTILNHNKESFFKLLDLYSGLDNLIILDFDGVVTSNKFKELYIRCVENYKTVICSANPTITEDWFHKRDLPLPNTIYSMKGKKSKLNKILQLHQKHDNTFYVDNEEKYLNFAWLFGIRTFIYNGKITRYTLKTK